MLCKDCGLDYDELLSNGRCKQCNTRFTNAKHRGKEYIPIVELKYTNPAEYTRAMNKRKNTCNSVPNQKTKVSVKSSIDLEVENEVNTDLESFLKKKGVKVDDNFLPLEVIFEWFYGLCQEYNYMNDLDIRRQCFDTSIINYMHELKNPSDDINFYAMVGKKIALVQQKRTPIDNELDKYKVVKPVFDYLRKNKDFLTMIQNVRIDLLKLVAEQKDPKYISDAPSMQKHDYVVKPADDSVPVVRKVSVPNRQNRYSIEIKKVKNLYGNPNYQPFVYNRSVFADSVEEAKSNFIEFLKQEFPNLIYNTKDLVITPYIDKECL